jgi:hypothetical protein
MASPKVLPGPGEELKAIASNYPKDIAISLLLAKLNDEYVNLEKTIKGIREKYLKMNIDDPAMQNDIADLRLGAVEAYKPAYAIEKFLSDEMGVDITEKLPIFDGEFPVSEVKEKGWELSFVSLKENAMRTLGGHCNVIGDLVLLERRLYHHTYLAAVMKPVDSPIVTPGKHGRLKAGADKEKNDMMIEFDFNTVVFDEDVSTIMNVEEK